MEEPDEKMSGLPQSFLNNNNQNDLVESLMDDEPNSNNRFQRPPINNNINTVGGMGGGLPTGLGGG